MKILLSTIFIILVSGCVSKTVVSSDPNFSKFISDSIALKKPVLVCDDTALHTKSMGSVSYKLLYSINDISVCPFGKTIGKLPVGKEIYVSAIEKHRFSGLKSATKVYFIGATSLSWVEEFNFYYLYGHEGHYEHQPW